MPSLIGNVSNVTEDLVNLISMPRRILLLTLLEDGPKDIQEIARRAPHIPLSIVVYDLEQLRARGIVTKRNNRYLITDKGVELLGRIPKGLEDAWRGLSVFNRVLNVISLRPVWTYIYYINPLILLSMSTPVVLLSLIMAWLTNIKLLLIFPYMGMAVPWYISPISIVIYGALDYAISYRLKPMVIHLREISNIMVSLIPIAISLSIVSLLYYFMVHLTEQILIPIYVISYLAPVLSLVMLSTLTALDTGVLFEHIAIIYLAVLYVPSSILYLTIVNL